MGPGATGLVQNYPIVKCRPFGKIVLVSCFRATCVSTFNFITYL